MKFTAATIAGFLKGEIEGNPETVVNTIAKIEEGHEGALSFLANPKYEHYIYTTESSVVLVNKSFVP
ncbi:MAG: UDP-3-O-[3-hydroxymyristoyl] glucosamine N-acyltransferase, partial [Bacteroidota bacterium]|nr:UDP-3-O-[3-hydroxymyristoyl] glucosamine N-acyltransferase [Bacteroidota bacterium]